MSRDEMLTDAQVDRREWAWATEHGAPEWASTVQLVGWLERGELPPHTLVWKRGWGEWLPALQVAELARAFPSVTAGSRRVARVAPGAVTPPPVPVSQYPRLRLLARDVIRDSSPYPVVIRQSSVAAPEATLVKYRDAEHAQQDQVTRQVPAAAMLEAAQAMQALEAPAGPRLSQRWIQHELGTFGETVVRPSIPPPRSLAAMEVAIETRALRPRAPARSRRAAGGYLSWIGFGVLVGSALGALSASELWRQRPVAFSSVFTLTPRPAARLETLAAPATPAEDRQPALPSPSPAPAAAAQPLAAAPAQNAPARNAPAHDATSPAPAPPPKPPRIRVSRSGEPADLQALRVTANDGFDRVVFEFAERVPGYRIEYIDRPARDCDSGQARRVEGGGRLDLRFFPARAHDDGGEPTYRPRELKPALRMVRELERSCDRNDVLSWVIGTASPNRYRVYEMAAPPRLVVQIEH